MLQLHPAVLTTDVERRVASNQTVEVKNFLQHIKDVPERTWREEREAQWEVAIRRWIALMETWKADNIPLGSCDTKQGSVFRTRLRFWWMCFTTRLHKQF